LKIVKTMGDQFKEIAEKMKPEKPEKKEIDEERLASKVKDALKPDIDKVAGRVSSIEKELEFERRLKPYKDALEKTYNMRQLTDEQFRLQKTKEIIENTIMPELRGMRKDVLGVLMVERCAMLEERHGVEPGTYVSPALGSLGIRLGEEEVAEEDQEAILRKLRARI